MPLPINCFALARINVVVVDNMIKRDGPAFVYVNVLIPAIPFPGRLPVGQLDRRTSGQRLRIVVFHRLPRLHERARVYNARMLELATEVRRVTMISSTQVQPVACCKSICRNLAELAE